MQTAIEGSLAKLDEAAAQAEAKYQEIDAIHAAAARKADEAEAQAEQQRLSKARDAAKTALDQATKALTGLQGQLEY